jgi:hypothetical protein
MPKRIALKKYFKTRATRNWVFTGETKDGNVITLVSLAYLKYKKHNHPKLKLNP